mmetsp:Transcript_44409/g.53701  ORF Transcript_44409/g.53701 Transcript_44409/m.53701 type:complete len:247 (-) Transcript_44409:350-1090(-)|eukprot:CAMPEP_0172507566 /NCGR_PEP_ID=MMETSP1066-20121228/204690_1 /TAXON_ID=671091 /ORGANISM="Coscinodiscus wailesii, Strain CCMP2513" /LENGTH=246 /DNA_ID=CAMNT_0013285149 /DNA_START=81 /DNA_END=821 /DNA_ORIENTATION=-
MFRKSSKPKNNATVTAPPSQSLDVGKSSAAAIFYQSLAGTDIIERVRVTIKNAHIFKLPPRQTAVGWRGADWKDKIWQGTAKVVERGEQTGIVLVDKNTESIFAVCPVREGAVDRCFDSSRYFVLRIENDKGRHMFIGMAFNERNDAFDFNTALEDSRRERELAKRPVVAYSGPTVDYSIKEGEKIHVAIPKRSGDCDMDVSPKAGESPPRRRRTSNKTGKSGKNGFLAPPSKDTPSRANISTSPS